MPASHATRSRGSVTVVMAMLALGLVGCAPTTPAPTATVETPGEQPTVPPASALRGEVTVDCDSARRHPAEPLTDDDLVFGSLSYDGLAHGYPTFDGWPVGIGPDGDAFYKIGADLTAEAEVTVSIGAAARDYAGILVESGRDGGYSQVTYRSCAELPADTVNWWVGGFLLHGRDTACVPIEVRSPGQEPERVDLALPVGACS